MEQKANTRTLIIKSPAEIVWDENKVLLSEVEKSILDNKRQLSLSLEKIKNASPNIDVRSRLCGLSVEKKSIEESITAVYNDLRNYIQTCASAINNTNGSLSCTLKLIKLLVMMDNDLYQKLDDELLIGNELRDILKDWCKNNNIKDEEVTALLDASFQRAYTLRNRISNLRNEINSKLNQYSSDIRDIKDELHRTLDTFSTEKAKQRQEIAALLDKKVSEVQAIIESSRHDMSEIETNARNKFIEYSSSIERQHEAYSASLKNYQFETETLIKEFSEKEKQVLLSQQDILAQQINKQKEEFEKELLNLKKSNKKCIIISIVGSSLFATFVSLLLTILFK